MNINDIKKVACSGAGVIGSSFAAHFALKGFPVNVYEINEAAMENAKTAVNNILDSLVAENVITDAQKAEIADRIHYTTDPAEAFGDVLFIQENGPEKLEIKHAIVKNLDTYAPADCIIASSTSGKKISEITEFSTHPERYVGAHPFNPPHLIPLVEMTKSEKTDPQVVETAVAFYKKVDKEPVVLKKEKLGFIANRLAHAVWREEMALVMEGVCTLEECDTAMCFGPGLRYAVYGPGMIYELSGKDGLAGAGAKFSELTGAVFSDLSKMNAVPEGWTDVSVAQIKDEIADMPEFKGKTREELERFRDHALIELLKLHHKL